MVVASQSGHVLPALTAGQERQLATAPVEELMSLPMLQPDKVLDPCMRNSFPSAATRCAYGLRR